MKHRRSGVILCCLLLAACSVAPANRARPIVVSATTLSSSGSTPALPELPGQSLPPARIDCRTSLSKDDALSRAVVEERLRTGSYYAALALVQALPAEQAEVAILRADILRRLQRPEASAWYAALQGSCKAAQAEQGLGLLAAQAGDYSAAVARLQAAARLAPADARIRNDLGYLYLHVGQDSAAEFELRTASELAANDRTPQINLLLLALLRDDAGNWQAGRQRVAPDALERQDLDRQCQRLLRLRSAFRAGTTPAERARCPINPQITGM